MQEKKQKADAVEGERAAASPVTEMSGPAGEESPKGATEVAPSRKLTREEKAQQREAAAREREAAQQRQATIRYFCAGLTPGNMVLWIWLQGFPVLCPNKGCPGLCHSAAWVWSLRHVIAVAAGG